jgi:hypothetical protein
MPLAPGPCTVLPSRRSSAGCGCDLAVWCLPKYTGALNFQDFFSPSRSARISNPANSEYVWGLNVRQCPGLDYKWVMHKPTQASQDYRRGLEQLRGEAWSHAF